MAILGVFLILLITLGGVDLAVFLSDLRGQLRFEWIRYPKREFWLHLVEPFGGGEGWCSMNISSKYYHLLREHHGVLGKVVDLTLQLSASQGDYLTLTLQYKELYLDYLSLHESYTEAVDILGGANTDIAFLQEKLNTANSTIGDLRAESAAKWTDGQVALIVVGSVFIGFLLCI